MCPCRMYNVSIIKGEMLYDLSLDDLRMLLIDELKPKNSNDYDYVEEEVLYEEEK